MMTKGLLKARLELHFKLLKILITTDDGQAGVTDVTQSITISARTHHFSLFYNVKAGRLLHCPQFYRGSSRRSCIDHTLLSILIPYSIILRNESIATNVRYCVHPCRNKANDGLHPIDVTASVLVLVGTTPCRQSFKKATALLWQE